MNSISRVFACVAFMAFASSASASELHRPTLSDVLRALSHQRGDFTIPAAWAGVWDFVDTDYDCITEEFKNTDANVDTLCTGQVIYGGEGPFEYECTGPVSDTDIDVECTYISEPIPDCSVTFTFALEAHRSGDTATTISIFSQDFTPDLCAFQEDFCIRTEGVGTRIGPEPAECATPVEAVTWGRVKAEYR